MSRVATLSASTFCATYRAELRDGEIGKPGAPQGQVGAVKLEEETGLDNGVVLPLHHLCHGCQIRFSGLVVRLGKKLASVPGETAVMKTSSTGRPAVAALRLAMSFSTAAKSFQATGALHAGRRYGVASARGPGGELLRF